MIDATLIEAIERLADSKAIEREVDGVPMSNHELHDMRPRLPEPAALELHTLDGLVDYIAADIDNVIPVRAAGVLTEDEVTETAAGAVHRVALHVVSPTEVRLVGELCGTFRQRFTYARAQHLASVFAFGTWYGHEEFVIRLGSMFTEAGDRAKVIKLAGTVTSDQGVKTEDDGITQTVHVRQGITLIGKAEVPNPVELAPFRTFHELEQPSGKYLLRARMGQHGVEWALFEADGGAWRQTCRERAAAYLEESLGAEELDANIPIIR